MTEYEAEHVLIGGLLREPSLAHEIDLAVNDFEVETYRIIYQAIIDKLAMSLPVDVITVGEFLDKTQPKDSTWLVNLGRCSKDCISTANLKAYAKIVKNSSKTRQAKAAAAELLNTIDNSEDASNCIDLAVQSLMQLSMTRQNYEYSISQALRGAVELIDDANAKKGTVGIKTGLIKLDKILSGFHDSDLYIIAARPAMGKTAILLNFALNASEQVGIISAEQPNDQIALRMISIDGKVNSHKMRTGSLDEVDYKRITAISSKLHGEQQIWINDKSGISITELARQARQWKHQHKIKALYVDYVQRVKWVNQALPRWEQVGNVVMALKELAREIQIPIIALAQVNRNVESRNDQRPHMGDIANSSEIEKEADCIMTLYRDEVYDINTQDKGLIEINVLKNRHGPTGFKKFRWEEKYMKVMDIDDRYEEYQDSKARAYAE